MYIEFLIVILNYFKTLKGRNTIVAYEWILPLVIASVCVYCGDFRDSKLLITFKDSSINVIGVLLGFSIAVITIITTGSSENLDGIKKWETEIEIKNRKISLYSLLLINFTYSVILEVILIISCLTLPLINQIFHFGHNTKLILYSIMVFIVLHILLLNLRNISDFYFTVNKNT